MVVFLLLIMSVNIYGSMDRVDNRSPFNASVSSYSDLEQEELCDVAMSKYMVDGADIGRYVRPHLKRIMSDQSDSPIVQPNESNIDILRRARAGDRNTMTKIRINDMVVRAIHQALEQQEEKIQLKEERIKEKYSGKKTAAIAAVTGAISTICTTICATLITLKSK